MKSDSNWGKEMVLVFLVSENSIFTPKQFDIVVDDTLLVYFLPCDWDINALKYIKGFFVVYLCVHVILFFSMYPCFITLFAHNGSENVIYSE